MVVAVVVVVAVVWWVAACVGRVGHPSVFALRFPLWVGSGWVCGLVSCLGGASGIGVVVLVGAVGVPPRGLVGR
ncbi:hypothetical protein Lfu02_07750 [Longispora fulva]|nr:hypothetical protein Lfu02_07750 [Longispora fulva]